MNRLFDKAGLLPIEQLGEWERFLEKNTGIQLSGSQHELFQSRINIRMRELGFTDYEAYLDYLQMDAEGVAEWQVLVDRLVVKETTFFRHRPSLELVRQFLQNRLQQGKQQGSFEILSMGCSTGEEPYALAALANHAYSDLGLPAYFGVTGMDISMPALAVARRGIYAPRSFSLMTDSEKQRYLDKADNGYLSVKESIRSRVCFSQVNVLHLQHKPVQLMDVIFCQNMLIYFRRWRRRRILNEFMRRLKPGGLLVIGLGEVTNWEHDRARSVASKDVHAYVKDV